ncbi:MAG: TVP38/TMEM64 family protein [Bacilli bacterium]
MWGSGLIALAACGTWLYMSGAWWKIPDLMRRAGVFGIGLSYGLILVQTFVPFAPFAILAGFNATVHGFIIGYITTFAGAFTGALLLYTLARRAVKSMLLKPLERFLNRHPKLERAFTRIPTEGAWSIFVAILTLRLQPWLPSSAIDVLAGAAKVRLAPFLLATFFGQAPMIALESYVGHRILHFQEHQKELWLLGALSLLFFALYVLWRRVASRRKRGV